LAPVVADGVGEDGAGLVEGSCRDAPPDVRIALEPVLRVLVPEVEGSVGARRAEGAVDGVERDVVDGVDLEFVGGARGLSVVFEGEVGAVCDPVSVFSFFYPDARGYGAGGAASRPAGVRLT